MDRSLRFGSRARDYVALLGLAFATAPPHGLTSPRTTNSQAHSSKGTPSPPKKEGSDGLYAIGFRYYFTPLPGYFSPFPHGTYSLSVTKEYLGLADGPARFTRDFRGPVLLGDTPKGVVNLRLQEYYPLRYVFPDTSTSSTIYDSPAGQQPNPGGPTTPHVQRLSAITHTWFGLFRVRSPLLTESLLFSLPVGTEMFHFPTFPPTALYIQAEVAGHDSGNSRFPYSEIPGSKLVYQLPRAYRRLQRPSSALGAKASTDRT